MPRLPVDGVKVQEIRITLGGKERQLVETALTAYSVNRIATPVVTLMTDREFLILLGAVVAIWLPDWLPIEWPEVTKGKSYAWIKDWLEIQNLAGAFGGAVLGSPLGPVGIILGATLGAAGVEVGEDIYSEITESGNLAITAGLIAVSSLLSELGIDT